MTEPYFEELPDLGTLYLQTTYIYFDEPIVFLCLNKWHQKFLCLCAENRDEYRWIITKISLTSLKKMIRNEIAVYEVLHHSNSWKYVVSWTGDMSVRESVSRVKFEDIHELDLPEKTALLDIPAEHRDKLIRQSSSIEVEFSRRESKKVLFQMQMRKNLNYATSWYKFEAQLNGSFPWNVRGRIVA